MKTYEEIRNLMKEKIQKEANEKAANLEKFATTIIRKYESLIEDDLISKGQTRLDLYLSGDHEVGSHIIDPGKLPVLDCLAYLKTKFLEKGFKDDMVVKYNNSLIINIE